MAVVVEITAQLAPEEMAGLGEAGQHMCPGVGLGNREAQEIRHLFLRAKAITVVPVPATHQHLIMGLAVGAEHLLLVQMELLLAAAMAVTVRLPQYLALP